MADGDGEDAGAGVSFEVWGRPGVPARAARRGNRVLRDGKPWSETVFSILRHLEDQGFDGAPRVIGSGWSPDGQECLTFVPGKTLDEPFAWSPDGAFELGRLIRRVHRSLKSWTPPAGATYRPWFAREMASPGSASSLAIGHCDAGPYNVVLADPGKPAIIDWEFAGPTDAVWELAHVVWMNAQLHQTAFSDPGLPLPEVSVRGQTAAAILDGYGCPARGRNSFMDFLVEYVIRSAAAKVERIRHTVEEPTAVVDISRDIRWRLRGAEWILENRSELQRAFR